MSDNINHLQQTTETENSAEKLPSKSARIGRKARQIFLTTAAGVTLALALEGCDGKNGGNGGEDPPPKNQPSVVANPNQKVDENSTLDINLGITDPDGVKSVSIVAGELADYFTIVDKTKLQLKSGKTLNYETDSQITGRIKVVDNKGQATEFEITIDLNDLAEVQPQDLFGDGGKLPNGEYYAIKEDEEAPGETLPIKFYNHGQSRRTLDDIKKEVDKSTIYASQGLIENLRFSRKVPVYPDGQPGDSNVSQAMIGFDSETDKVILYAKNGSEVIRISDYLYGRFLQYLLDKIENSQYNSHGDNFRRVGTKEYNTFRDMVIAQVKNKDKLYEGADYGAQKAQTKVVAKFMLTNDTRGIPLSYDLKEFRQAGYNYFL